MRSVAAEGRDAALLARRSAHERQRSSPVSIGVRGALLALSTVVAAGFASVTAAQDEGGEAPSAPAPGWSQPALALALEPGERSVRADLAVDDRGGLHGVFVVGPEAGGAAPRGPAPTRLVYARLAGGTWSDRVEIGVTGSEFPSLECDRASRVLLVSRDARLLHTPLDGVLGEASWNRSLAPFHRRMALNPDVVARSGRIHVVFAEIGRGVFHTVLGRSGSWSVPVAVSRTPAGRCTDWPRVALDTRGVLHAVWTELEMPKGWPPSGVYYSRSATEGSSWSEPIELAGTGHDEINVVVGPGETVHVAWNGMAGMGGRYYRFSLDGGRSWSAVETVTERGFTEGWPQLAVDGDGVLHWLSSLLEEVSYARRGANGWSELERVGFPPGGRRLGGERPRMSLGPDRRLHVLMPGEGGWWHLWRPIDVEEAP